jgi:hypothetical protein
VSRTKLQKKKDTTMFEVYAFPTPNSVKVPIALEEMGSIISSLPSICAKASRRRMLSGQ